jgi:hypothetical protein
MSKDIVRRELYRAALLELSPEKLRRRIDEAEQAILRRVVELRQDDSNSREESVELNDALRGLRLLASTECATAPSAVSGSAPSEVTS